LEAPTRSLPAIHNTGAITMIPTTTLIRVDIISKANL
jgi:hypothetical protein